MVERLFRLYRLANALGSFALTLPVLIAGVGAASTTAYYYIQGAPWPVLALMAVGLASVLFIPLIGLSLILNSPPSPGVFSPRKLRFYRLPIWKVSWDFDNYLGGRCGDGSPVLITSFQTRFKINWGKGITPKRSFICSNRTGEQKSVLVECENPYVLAEKIEFIPKGKWYHGQVFFGDDGLTKEQFLKQFDGLEFVFEYDDRQFRRSFPREEIAMLFDRFWEYSNRSAEPKPRMKDGAQVGDAV